MKSHDEIDALFARVPLASLSYPEAVGREERVRVLLPRLLLGGSGTLAMVAALFIWAPWAPTGQKAPYLSHDQAAAYAQALGNVTPGFDDVKQAIAEADFKDILGD